MPSIKKLYKDNIYGIIGTLIFHILLISAFLVADIDLKREMKEDIIIIEFPDALIEPDEPEEESISNEEELSENFTENNIINAQSTNRASNQAFSNDEFFDEAYVQEIENAQRLVDEVNNQLQKRSIDIEDIPMPAETTEGLNPDSIKNIIYTGESNITYYLENRYHIYLPIPVYLAQGGGTVIVDIIVNKNGEVINQAARENPSISDLQIYEYAEIAASRTVFNASDQAPDKQPGTIQYVFIPQ